MSLIRLPESNFVDLYMYGYNLYIYHIPWTTSLTLCLFVWGFSSHSRIFHLYGDLTIAGEGLQILTYARHSWPLNSECSIASHTCCDTDQSFLMVIYEDP